MKPNQILLVAVAFILFSCFEEEEDPLIACFELNAESIKVGELLTITDCSEGAESYIYDFGSPSITELSEPNPTVYFSQSGEFTITQKVRGAGKFSQSEKTIIVEDFMDGFLHPEVADDWNTYSIGFYYLNGHFYYLLKIWPQSGTIYWSITKIDDKMEEVASTLIPIDGKYPNRSFIEQLPSGGIRVNAFEQKALDYNLGYRETIFDANLNLLSSTQSEDFWLGSIENSTVYYGASVPDGPYLPTLSIRDENNAEIDQKVYDELPYGVIGGVIKTSSGFLAFGGSYESSDRSKLTNYKPMLLTLDHEYNIVSSQFYDSFEYSNMGYSKLSGPYRIKALDNGNYVLYSHGNIQIVDPSGKELKLIATENKQSLNSIIPITGGFIASDLWQIVKYDYDGNELKTIDVENSGISNFIEKEGIIYFFTTSPSECIELDGGGCISYDRPLMGAFDSDLVPVAIQ